MQQQGGLGLGWGRVVLQPIPEAANKGLSLHWGRGQGLGYIEAWGQGGADIKEGTVRVEQIPRRAQSLKARDECCQG